MQSRLREHWSPAAAMVAASTAFAILHIDVSAVHIVLAFVLGLYLGYVVELTGSTLPAIVCHVVNNVALHAADRAGRDGAGPPGQSHRRADRGRAVRRLRVVAAPRGAAGAAAAAAGVSLAAAAPVAVP